MSINFPNNPSVGEKYIFNNTTYEWDGTKWASTISVTGSEFSGDYDDLANKPTIPTNNNELTNGAGFITGVSTFSGNYNDLSSKPTIPTNNNQLTNGAGFITDTVTGDFSVSGAVSIGGTLTYEDVTNIDSVGLITARSGISADNTILVNRTGSTQTAFQATLSGVTKVNIEAGGSATFDGGGSFGTSLDIGSYNNGGATTNGVRLYGGSSNGQVLVSTTATGNTAVAKFGSNIQLDADGSASFGGGNLTISSGGWLQTVDEISSDRSAGNVFRGKESGTTTSTITAAGAATFAGDVFSGASRVNPGNGVGSYLAATNGVLATTSGSVPVFRGYVNGTGTPTSSIKNDGSITSEGSATFATTGTFGDPSTSNSNAGVILNAFANSTNGWINAYRGGVRLFQNDGNTTTPTVEIVAADGSATFASNIILDTVAGTTGEVFSVKVGGTEKIRFNGTGSATFASDIDLTDSTVDVYSQTTNAASKTIQTFSDIGGTKVEKVAIFADGRAVFGGVNVNANLTPTSGTSIENFYTTNGGVIQAFDRDNNNLEPLQVRGSNWSIAFDGSATFGTTTAATSRNITMSASTGDAGIQITGVNSGTNVYITNTPGSTAATYIGNTNNRNLNFVVGGNVSTKMIIDSSGNVTLSSDAPYLTLSDNGNQWIRGSSSLGTIQFATGNSERLRITSAGSIGIGNDGSFGLYTGTNDRNLILGTGSGSNGIQLYCSTTGYGGIYFGDTNSGTARYSGYVEYKNDGNFLRFATQEVERARIDSAGVFLVGKTSDTYANQGVRLHPSSDAHFTRNDGNVVAIRRNTSDGTLIDFWRDGTSVGNITVSSGTVSLTGAHLSRWTQLPGNAERTEILMGTVLSNLDEMCEWTDEENI